MAIPISELQSLTPAAKIELFVMELIEGTHYATGNPTSVPTVFRFHAGTNMNTNSNIIWQGNTYEKFPIVAEGFAFEGRGQIPRPNLTMSNLGGITRSGEVITVTDLMLLVNLITPHNDLINTKITRLQVLASSLDAANFPGNTNPFGTPNSNELPQEIFFIDRKQSESRNIVQFELVSRLDQQNKKLPKRQVTRNEFPSVGGFING
jgi:lambda family phage minor tail protein L